MFKTVKDLEKAKFAVNVLYGLKTWGPFHDNLNDLLREMQETQEKMKERLKKQLG